MKKVQKTTHLPITSMELAKNGLHINDTITNDNRENVAKAIHALAEASGIEYTKRAHAVAEDMITKSNDVLDAAAQMMKFEDMCNFCGHANEELMKSITMFRSSLERELKAIEHCVKMLKSIDVHGVAADLESMAKSMGNPLIKKLIGSTDE